MNKLKTAIVYGLIAGAIMNTAWWIFNALFMDMENYDMSRGELIGYATMILALTAVFIGVKNYRDQLPAQAISFGQAFMVGLYIVLVASSVYVIGWLIYSNIMMPDFMDQYVSSQLKSMQEAGASAVEIKAKQDEFDMYAEMYKNPFIKVGLTFMEIFPIGLVVALISAAVLKRKA